MASVDGPWVFATTRSISLPLQSAARGREDAVLPESWQDGGFRFLRWYVLYLPSSASLPSGNVGRGGGQGHLLPVFAFQAFTESKHALRCPLCPFSHSFHSREQTLLVARGTLGIRLDNMRLCGGSGTARPSCPILHWLWGGRELGGGYHPPCDSPPLHVPEQGSRGKRGLSGEGHRARASQVTVLAHCPHFCSPSGRVVEDLSPLTGRWSESW